MTAFFVTATGTDIGKTYIAAGLVRLLKARGEGVAALKPVVSGFFPESVGESDPAVLLRAMGERVTRESIARISPWRFSAPLSPDMAAAREGDAIDFATLVDFCRGQVGACQGCCLIEGVGGVMVPLDERHTVLDWMQALGLPLVLVAGTYLGTLSHTLTALDVVRRAGLEVAALVLNESNGAAVPLSDTLAVLGRFAPKIPIQSFRRTSSVAGDDVEFARLWQILAGWRQIRS